MPALRNQPCADRSDGRLLLFIALDEVLLRGGLEGSGVLVGGLGELGHEVRRRAHVGGLVLELEHVALDGVEQRHRDAVLFAGVDIAHFMTTDIDGLSHVVDVVENVGLTLEEEVDDPEAGNVYLSAGEQVITSEAVPTLLRARNFRGGSEVQTDNRGAFMATLAERLLEKSGLPFVFQLDAIAGSLKTDWSATDLMAVADALRGMKASSVQVALVPGSETEAAGGTVFIASSVSSLLERMKAGEAFESQEAEVTVDQTKFEIEIRNGAYIDGAGAQMSEILTQAGFKVGDVGNANDGVIYPETLVIYKDPAQAQNAEAVVQALQAGRVINGGDFYTFDTEILVILGEDWQPIL